MQEQPLDAATHLGWRHDLSAADADHLLIRSEPQLNEATAEPLLRFNNDSAPVTSADAVSAAAPDAAAIDDAPVDDAVIDAPPYLWGGEALAPEAPVVFGSAPSQQAVFS